jgi:hypothetical protein
MKNLVSVLLTVIGLFIFSGSALAQETNATELEPKTRLEAFQARTGVVIVRGFSRIGSATGSDGSSIEVEALELRDIDSKTKEYGITIEVTDDGKPERRNTSFIDYDEMDSLLKGLEYLSKVDNSVTQLKRFEADYRTRGDFFVSAFSGRGSTITIAISSGTFRPVTSFFKLEDVKVISGLIMEAKIQLDAIRQK